MFHLERGQYEIPVAQDHRRAGAAEECRGAQEAGDGQQPHRHVLAGADAEGLQQESDDSRRRRRYQNGRPEPRECTANRCPVKHERHFEDDHGALLFQAWSERHAGGDENRGEAGIEAKELHARLARHEHERERYTDSEMCEEEEEDHRLSRLRVTAAAC
jgi:hypothetical protein